VRTFLSRSLSLSPLGFLSTCDNKRATYVANNYLGLRHTVQAMGSGVGHCRLWRRSRQVAKPSPPASRSRACGQFMRKAVRDREIGRSRDPKALSNVTVANDVIWICKWPERGQPGQTNKACINQVRER